MLYVTVAQLWTLTVFTQLTYTIFLASTLVYTLPVISQWRERAGFRRSTKVFEFVSPISLLWVKLLLLTPLAILNGLWVMPATTAWFGHIAVSSFSWKMYFIVLCTYSFITVARAYTLYLSGRGVYDSFLANLQFLYWTVLLFFVNTLYAALFILEVLSALVFVLVIASTYSTSYAYRNTNLSFGHTFHLNTPHTHLQSLLYYFWVSMLAALSLFLTCLYLHLKLLTTDWFLLETVLHYTLVLGSAHEILSGGFVLFLLLVCLFIKCGIVPLFYWKPTFFRGLSYDALFFYVTFFYLFVFLFTIHLLTAQMVDVITYYPAVLLLLILAGMVTLLFILCEAYYIKPFLAMSSTLNSLLVLMAVASTHSEVIVFWL
jgi:hypothetical protein